MIDQKELRIGNWLIDYYGVQRQVAYIGETIGLKNDIGGTDKYQNKPIYSNDLKDLHPIPLTGDILEKCGLKGKPNYIAFQIGQMDFSIHETYCIGCFNDNEYGHEAKDEIKIKSLHQLQNLYWCLCGEELNYQP